MKSKKLFAILTLVAFMMTLIPAAAFGAPTFPSSAAPVMNYSASRSTVKAEYTNLKAQYTSVSDTATPGENVAKFTLTFKTASATLASDKTVQFVIKTTSDLVLGKVIDATGSAASFDFAQALQADTKVGLLVEAKPNDNGEVEVWLGASKPISFNVKFFSGPDAIDGSPIGKSAGYDVNVEVKKGAIQIDAFDSSRNDTKKKFKGGSGNTENNAMTIAAGEGYRIQATLPGEEEDVKVTFYEKEVGGTWAAIGTAETDSDGKADIWVDQEKAAKFVYKAKTSSSDSPELYITVVAAEAYSIEAKTASGKKYAVDETGTIEFVVKDEFGNAVNTAALDIEITSAPADSDLEDRVYTNVAPAGSGGSVKWTGFEPDEPGKYTIRAQFHDPDLRNAKATVEVEAVEFEKATGLTFKLKNDIGSSNDINVREQEEVTALVRRYTPAGDGVVEKDKVAGYLEVYKTDASGVQLLVDDADLTFASSNGSHVKVAKAAGDPTQGAAITLTKDAAGTYQITAYYGEDNLLATYELKVVGGPSAIKATPTVNGKTATVALQYVDKNGENTYGAQHEEKYTLSVPEGLTITDVKWFNKKGAASFVATAQEAGTYTVTVLTYGNRSLAATFDIVIGQEAKPVSKTVTMFIGAPGYMDGANAKVTDVAPFIVDGRTFVAVRPVAEAFGAEIGWNEATQTVTLTTADTTVTIVIGSNAITVVKDGVTSTVTADVAAFIKDGRTVLPFRAVGEAFGATVSYDAATQAVTYEI